jgi:amidohydrolase
MDIKQLVANHKDQIIEFRRDLHRIPELAFQEEKTATYVSQQLNKEGLAVRTGIAQRGVEGLLSTGVAGPTLLIRADMDALPLQEATGLPFASNSAGVMHACGHDAHMAMVLGAAMVLNTMRSKFKGNIKFIFQPAEEGPGGAKPMIEAGIMENPHVDYAVGCHVWPDIPEGSIGVKAGPLMAAMDRFDLKILGQGGHGAMPHLCIDPLDTACQIVDALQRIVSRQMNPLHPAVVTIGRLHAGTAFNIIPETAELSGTTRTFDRMEWEIWPRRIETIVKGVCQSMGASYELTFTKGYPPTINDEDMAQVVAACAQEVVGQENVVEPFPTMGGEDMGFFLEKAKGCFFCLGAGRKGGAPIHSPRFDFNENILLSGVETFCRIALKLLC